MFDIHCNVYFIVMLKTVTKLGKYACELNGSL